MKKSKLPASNLSRQLKKAGVNGPIGRRKGAWELEKEKLPVPGAPKLKPVERKRNPLALTEKEHIEMARDKAGGLPDKEIALKYAVSVSYVQDAMRTLFVNNKVGREILKGVLLDNAISGGMRVRQTIDELTPMQAVMATSAMTQRFIDIEKHSANQQSSDIDFSELSEIGAILKDLNAIAGLGPVIDVDSSVTAVDEDED